MKLHRQVEMTWKYNTEAYDFQLELIQPDLRRQQRLILIQKTSFLLCIIINGENYTNITKKMR